MTFFVSKAQVALIIEGVFFYSLSLPPVCLLALEFIQEFIQSLPPVCAYLLFCRGGATHLTRNRGRATTLAYNRGPPAKRCQILRAYPNNRGQLTKLTILSKLTNEPLTTYHETRATRHERHATKSPSTSVENSLQINPFYAKQTQFS